VDKALATATSNILRQFDTNVLAPPDAVTKVGDVVSVTGVIGGRKIKGDRADIGGNGMPQEYVDVLVGKRVGDKATYAQDTLTGFDLVIDQIFHVTKAVLSDEVAKQARFENAEDLTVRTLKNAKISVQRELINEYAGKLVQALIPACQVEPVPLEMAHSKASDLWSSHRAKFRTEREALDNIRVDTKEQALGAFGRKYLNDYVSYIILSAFGRENAIENFGGNDHVSTVIKEFLSPIWGKVAV
jgi:hypothetical protein